MTALLDTSEIVHISLNSDEHDFCIVDNVEIAFRDMSHMYLNHEEIEIALIKKKQTFCSSCRVKAEKYIFSKKIEQYSPDFLKELSSKIEDQRELKNRWKIVLAKTRPVDGFLSEHFFAYISEEREKDYKVAFTSTDTNKRVGHERKRVPKKSITDFVEREEDAERIIAALKKNTEEYKDKLSTYEEALKKEYNAKGKELLEKIKEEIDFV